jgi:hypothetical protein
MRLESRPGQGTRTLVLLPAVPSESASDAPLKGEIAK